MESNSSPLILPEGQTPKAEDALAVRKPDFSKKFANLHYMSEATGEVGTITIRQTTTIEDVFRQYCRMFPKEAKIFSEEVKLANEELHRSSGLSVNKSMMSMGKIPDIIMTACKFLYGADYWDDKRNTMNFLRSNPGLMVGDHRRKDNGNVIIH